MLITFKSQADGDVIMFGAVGQMMIAALGKDPGDAQGIVTETQLPTAIERLVAAIAESKLDPQLEEGHAEPGHDNAPTAPEPAIPFFKRAVPLLDMLRHAERAGVPVTWHSEGSPA